MLTRSQLLAMGRFGFNARVLAALQAFPTSPYLDGPLRGALDAILADGASVHCFSVLWRQQPTTRRTLTDRQLQHVATRRGVQGPGTFLRRYRVGVAHEIRTLLNAPSLNELVRIMPGWSSPQAFGRTLGNTLGVGASTALLQRGDPAQVCARLISECLPQSIPPRQRVRLSRAQIVFTALSLVRPHLEQLPPDTRVAVQDALATFPPAA